MNNNGRIISNFDSFNAGRYLHGQKSHFPHDPTYPVCRANFDETVSGILQGTQFWYWGAPSIDEFHKNGCS